MIGERYLSSDVLETLLDDGRPEAALGSDAGDDTSGQSDALRLLLLADTYAYARAHCPHYAAYPKGQIVSFADFRELPILERQTLVDDLLRVCSHKVEAVHHTATSGTSTGASLFIPRSRNEYDALEMYRRAISRLSVDGRQHDGVTLRLVPGGRLIPGGTGNPWDQIGVYNLNMARQNLWDNWDYLIAQLFAEFPLGWVRHPITLIHATPPCGLVLLTRYMLERGIDPAETSVRRLVVSGGWLGKTTRRWLQSTWRSELATAYSCAELNEPARECRLWPGRFHFGMPVHAEVVEPLTGRSVEEGAAGRLLLTGTFPFHQACMLIRYAVGDWARWFGWTRCECGLRTPSIEFLGRESSLFLLPLPNRPRPLSLPSVPTLEALSRFAYVPDIPRPQYRYEAQATSKPGVMLHVECYSVGGRDWQEARKKEIRTAVLEENRELREAVETDGIGFDVRLHARSELTVRIGMR